MPNTIIATPRTTAATVTASGALAAGKHNPVNAAGGAVTMTLPADANEGSHLSVYKLDTSANTITITGTIDGVTTRRTLRDPRDSIEFVRGPDITASWWVVGRYNTDVPTVTMKDDFKLATNSAAGAIGTAATVINTAYDTTIGNSGNNNGLVSAAVGTNLGVNSENSVRFHVGTAATGAFGFLGENTFVPSHGKLFYRRYYQISALPSFRMSVWMLKQTDINGAHVVHLSVSSTGSNNKWAFVNVDTVATAAPSISTATVLVDEYTRHDIYVDTLTSTISDEIFTGTNLSGLRPNETITMTYTTPALPIGYVEDGILTNPNVALNLDLSHPLNANTWVPLGGGGGAGTTGSSGVVLIAAGDPDPSPLVSGIIYAREVL